MKREKVCTRSRWKTVLCDSLTTAWRGPWSNKCNLWSDSGKQQTRKLQCYFYVCNDRGAGEKLCDDSSSLRFSESISSGEGLQGNMVNEKKHTNFLATFAQGTFSFLQSSKTPPVPALQNLNWTFQTGVLTSVCQWAEPAGRRCRLCPFFHVALLSSENDCIAVGQ